jgi:hypothetical protein
MDFPRGYPNEQSLRPLRSGDHRATIFREVLPSHDQIENGR